MKHSFWGSIPPVTLTIFFVTLFVYLIQVIVDAFIYQSFSPFFIIGRLISGPSIQSMVFMGGEVSSLVVRGDWYRLFMPILLHSSLMHIFSNMLTLIIVGPFVEQLFGRVKYLIIYIVAGIWGNLLTFIFDPNPNVVSVGASGALFGLFGAMIAIAWYNRNNLAFKRQLVIFTAFAVFNLISNFNAPSVDIWAHLGGLIAGVLVALVSNFPSSQYGGIKILVRVGSVIILLLPLVWTGFQIIGN